MVGWFIDADTEGKFIQELGKNGAILARVVLGAAGRRQERLMGPIRGMLLGFLGAGPAEASYWNLFNLKGESSASAIYVE